MQNVIFRCAIVTTKSIVWYGFYVISSCLLFFNSWPLIVLAFQGGSILYSLWSVMSMLTTIVNIFCSVIMFIHRYQMDRKYKVEKHNEIYQNSNSVYGLEPIFSGSDSVIQSV